MNAADFLADLEAKPRWLDGLADRFARGNPFAAAPRDVDRVLLLGMGSSRYAASVAAHDLRVAGIAAAAEPASVDASWPPDARTLVVAISATGESAETLDAVERYRGRSPVIALVNAPASSLAIAADVVVEMGSGDETGGVACRTFQHSGLLLRALESHLTGLHDDLASLTHLVSHGTADLLNTSPFWLPGVANALASPYGVALIAPAERFSSAEQGALMIREGPRRPAVASETGDWAHVDVYLTRSIDYRAILFRGSRWDDQALEWLAKRSSTVVAVGADTAGAAATIRYPGDDDPDVARHTEVLIPELLAATWWRTSS
ncbi:MAG TPA: SIS domain-containing protein [Candidatus Limnocylindrales bacterium]|jgi:fructoselysine-6-P-deglycase FrlB-like protein|nr:SIS domain-containing protein [Candidatus Limnocylindrales bacterium]